MRTHALIYTPATCVCAKRINEMNNQQMRSSVNSPSDKSKIKHMSHFRIQIDGINTSLQPLRRRQ